MRVTKIEEHDNKISNVITDFSIKEKKVVIVDADYIPFIASYTKEGEEETSLEDYYSRVDNEIFKIVNSIEEYFEISNFYLCVKGDNNFRKEIYPDYKKQRKERSEIVEILNTYLITNHKAIPAHYGEADDLVFTISEEINHKGIVVSPDKDLLQIPTILYNPSKNIWFNINEEESMYNIALQSLMGDAADQINLFKGVGVVTSNKVIKKGMTKYQYIKSILNYIKKYDDYKNKLRMSYRLIKLININE